MNLQKILDRAKENQKSARQHASWNYWANKFAVLVSNFDRARVCDIEPDTLCFKDGCKDLCRLKEVSQTTNLGDIYEC